MADADILEAIPLEVRVLFVNAKESGYEVRRGKSRVTLLHQNDFVGGWDKNGAYWYIADRRLQDGDTRMLQRLGFRLNDNAPFGKWQLGGAESWRRFKTVAEALTGQVI